MISLDRYFSDRAAANTGVVLDFEGTASAGRPAEPIRVGAVLLRVGPAGLQLLARRLGPITVPSTSGSS